ncbi:transcriptional regulator [Citrobacter amalonaticus]|uniref:transcriptional regulator n=1 Tax=Citrobacter amalonaticus TaxID=35703 RepID=UPI0019083FA2|nr:YdaS family helix-turn-helix protein [Citrobacter amalonaticus]EIL2948545.1 helix-turn-helix domain-containing protein [Salmonella enterica subsp. enterica serovar Uganda]EIX2952243.1 helix-turn-helix domain-containing protein [Salmonella enterica subsp. enterica serovar Uganda]MBJ9079900.1 helix-turn-helix domain-containing protein [Citrobacter amalonaticus]MBW0870945.1 helix-turn-helix domain-containing protein [Citrobacter amalonaticus]
MTPELKRQICALTTQTEIAKQLGTTSQAVSLWLNHEVPAHRVIPICRILMWKVTPHEIRSDIYPNPTDGLPVQDARA